MKGNRLRYARKQVTKFTKRKITFFFWFFNYALQFSLLFILVFISIFNPKFDYKL